MRDVPAQPAQPADAQPRSAVSGSQALSTPSAKPADVRLARIAEMKAVDDAVSANQTHVFTNEKGSMITILVDGDNRKIAEREKMPDGTKIFRDPMGRTHLVGLPAVTHPDGSTEYWDHGRQIASGSVTVESGVTTETLVDMSGKLSGTKVTDLDGTINYFNAEGERHRNLGPAVIRPDGQNFFYNKGLHISEAEFMEPLD